MPIAVVSFRVDNNVYLLADANGNVTGFTNVVAALDTFENVYGRGHGRSFEGSMSACIHFMTYEIRCHEIDEVQSLVSTVVEIPTKLATISSLAGVMRGIVCTGPNAVSWHESGLAPRLVR